VSLAASRAVLTERRAAIAAQLEALGRREARSRDARLLDAADKVRRALRSVDAAYAAAVRELDELSRLVAAGGSSGRQRRKAARRVERAGRAERRLQDLCGEMQALFDAVADESLRGLEAPLRSRRGEGRKREGRR
jgi:hypothetical protein